MNRSLYLERDQIILYCLDCDLFGACLIWTLHSLSLEMVVDSSDNRELSVLARHSCGNVRIFDYFDDQIDHFDALQCINAALLEAWRLYRGSSAQAQSKAAELHWELARG